MLVFTIFVCFVTDLCFMKCEGHNKEIIITQKERTKPCLVEQNHRFQVGDNVTINIINEMSETNLDGGNLEYHNHGFNVIYELKVNKRKVNTISVSKSLIGEWKFTLTYLCGVQKSDLRNQPYWNGECVFANCTTYVNIDDPISPNNDVTSLWIMITVPGAIIAVLIMIAQTICILHYKSRAQALDPHRHLTKVKLETKHNIDGDRYCSTPRHKTKIEPSCEMNRASEIYEEPNINGALTAPPPVPSTPRPMDRGASSMRLLPPSSATSTLRSTISASSTFPKPAPVDQDTLTKLAIARRAPQPLPQEEFYSETTAEDVYEQPPTPEPPSPVKPIAPPPLKKPVTPATKPFGGKQLPEFPMGGLKPWNPPPALNKPNKPPISQSKPLPPRNNVMQVPILQIPGPSSLKKPAVASKPLIKKPDPKPPLPPPNPKPAPLVSDYPQHTDSSDEEWTYEELPKYNIYST